MKKIICFLLSALLILSAVPFSTAFAEGAPFDAAHCGDVNGDGEISAGDARLALRTAVGLEPDIKEDTDAFKAADVRPYIFLAKMSVKKVGHQES